jgi:hypothetical protein
MIVHVQAIFPGRRDLMGADAKMLFDDFLPLDNEDTEWINRIEINELAQKGTDRASSIPLNNKG